MQGRWSLTDAIFRGGVEGPAGAIERRRALAELLLERYGIVTREQVLAEGIKGGFAMLYDTFANLETLGICRRGYFIEGMGGAQFALPGAVERLRAGGASVGLSTALPGAADEDGRRRALVIAAADPAQPYGAALAWPKRERTQPRPARVAGAHVVLVADEPVLYVERGGRALVTLAGGSHGRSADPTREALAALAEAVRAGRVGKLALERIDGQPAIASSLADALVELGFHPGPRRLTLSA
jgi:ATP-dependent Lhr-like helicase